MLQCVAVWCRVLQYVAAWCSMLQCVAVWSSMLQCVTHTMIQWNDSIVVVWCSMLQCVAVWRSMLQCVAHTMIQLNDSIVAVWCSMLQCVAVWRSMLQCVAHTMIQLNVDLWLQRVKSTWRYLHLIVCTHRYRNAFQYSKCDVVRCSMLPCVATYGNTRRAIDLWLQCVESTCRYLSLF